MAAWRRRRTWARALVEGEHPRYRGRFHGVKALFHGAEWGPLARVAPPSRRVVAARRDGDAGTAFVSGPWRVSWWMQSKPIAPTNRSRTITRRTEIGWPRPIRAT